MRPEPQALPSSGVAELPADGRIDADWSAGPGSYRVDVATYLDRILEHHRARAHADERSEAWLHEAIARQSASDPARALRRDMLGALDRPGLSVIAEVKRRSPSKGDLAEVVDPDRLARLYEGGGAAALSVLTDDEFFGGSVSDLVAARAATGLPVLRKDFTVDRRDVLDARLMGADCVLLIVAALDDDLLGELLGLTRELGMAALVETHDEAEVDRALAVGADIIGVNQRDLVTFEVDTDRAVRVRARIPDTAVAVAESGISGVEDAERLSEAGYDAVLIGETFVRSADPSAAVREIVSAGQRD